MIPAELLPHLVLLIGAVVCSIGGRLVEWPAIWKLTALCFVCGAAWLCVSTDVAVDPLAGLVTRGHLAKQVALLGYATGFLLILSCLEQKMTSIAAGDQAASILVALNGLVLVGQSDDLLALYLGVEVTSFALLPLILLSGPQAAQREGKNIGNRFHFEAAIKYSVRNAVSSALILLGLAFLIAMTNSTELSVIEQIFTESSKSTDASSAIASPSMIGNFVIILLVAGLGMRMAAVPFQFGLPDLFQGVSNWVAGVLAMFPLLVCWVALFRLINQCLAGYELISVLVLNVLAILSMVSGNVLALYQSHLRRLWVYVLMVQCGFLLASTAVSLWGQSHQSLFTQTFQFSMVSPTMLLLIAYIINTTGLAAVFVYLGRDHRELEYLDDLTGIIRSEPVAAICCVSSLLGLAGAPFLSGFWWRLFVLLQSLSLISDKAIPATHLGFIVIALVLVLSMIVQLIVLLRIVVLILFSDQLGRPVPAGGESALTVALIATFLNVGLGLFPGIVLNLFW